MFLQILVILYKINKQLVLQYRLLLLLFGHVSICYRQFEESGINKTMSRITRKIFNKRRKPKTQIRRRHLLKRQERTMSAPFFEQKNESIPEGVTHLRMFYKSRIEKGTIPDSVKILELSQLSHVFDKDVLPDGLRVLVIKSFIVDTSAWVLTNLPANLEVLHLDTPFHGTIEYPAGLKELKLMMFDAAASSNKVTENLPNSLRKVIFGGNVDLNSIPEGVTEAYFIGLRTTGRLPNSVENVKLQNFKRENRYGKEITMLKKRDGTTIQFDQDGFMKKIVNSKGTNVYIRGLLHNEKAPAVDGKWYLYGKSFETEEAMRRSPYYKYMMGEIDKNGLEILYVEGFPVHNVPEQYLLPSEKPFFPYKGDLEDTSIFSVNREFQQEDYISDDELRTFMRHWVEDWFAGEFPEFNQYVGELYSGRNNPNANYNHIPELYGKYSTPEKAARGLTEKIYSLTPLTHDVYAYRGIFGYGFENLCMNSQPGTLVGFHRLMSLSVSYEVSYQFSKSGEEGLFLLISLPHGTNLINISWLKRGQPEIILPPNCVFEIVKRIPNVYSETVSARPPGNEPCKSIVHLKLVEQIREPIMNQRQDITWFM